ncbi:hypothetical protein [Pedobacter sp. SYP-B3415]|uniref:TlpA family protein disulfide reductase n=1 Tax=Pedobacter sp. SYP-B3415 TaxID=2496641 RepID=UPI00101B9DC7|nr:hypothetical protein [Pedobacter sp. SYP-B3415]
MKKLILILLLLPAILLQQSCIVMVKSLAKGIVNDYDDYADTNISSQTLLGADGRTATINQSFSGKTVYAVVYSSPLNHPHPGDSTRYAEMQNRFKPYKDVQFISVYNGDNEQYWREFSKKNRGGHEAYRLTDRDAEPWKGLGNVPHVLIIGADGTILGYKAPNTNSKVLADYVLYQARSGKDATRSSKEVIKEINESGRFKSEQMKSWYTAHFKEPADNVSLSFSNSN